MSDSLCAGNNARESAAFVAACAVLFMSRALLHISMHSALLLAAIVVVKNKESTANTIIYSTHQSLPVLALFWRFLPVWCAFGSATMFTSETQIENNFSIRGMQV